MIVEARDQPDVAEMHRRVRAIEPDVALSTVYRAIRLLEAIGVLQWHDFNQGRSRYELMPKRHHDHLIDVESGRVIEFRCQEIERLQAKIAHRHGYQIVDHRLDIYVAPLASSTKREGS